MITFLTVDPGQPSGWIYIFSLIGSIVFAILFGGILDRVINRPLKDEPVFSVIMATISLSIILRALASMIAGPMSILPISPFTFT